METLDRLQEWFATACDGDWEHGSGFTLESLDNPGWMLKVDLNELDIDVADMDLSEERGGTDWLAVRVVAGRLRVVCGPRDLREALDRFLDLVAGDAHRVDRSGM